MPIIADLRADFLNRIGTTWHKAPAELRTELIFALGNLYDRFHQEGLADRHFDQALTSGSPTQHAQRLAELLMAEHLWTHGFDLDSANEGPDFRATKDGHSVWVELVTPEPNGIDPVWLTGNKQGVWKYPHPEIALRYTSALKEKHQKLVGNGRGKVGYLSNGIVAPRDIYVIAINQHLLQRSFRTLSGISQIPVACEVAFAVGPQQLHIDRNTRRIVHSDHAHRPEIPKQVAGKPATTVPADSFLNPSYDHVSAIYAVDLMEEVLVKELPGKPLAREHLSAMAYNPNAANLLPLHLIPAQSHWTATPTNELIEIHRK
ncbi:hypothetical protein HDC36_000026 [Xanthomonas sp. JAI131]|uniref:hypothetical protein n=1 Tax=Xanthomonas sp. JAI131 TaxID=2723067 RepID=UPI0015C90287|nr:hypothetical protein [Xanthomonas sp. JAI131]NYF18589.1 hypothetical protein [Xanthomonas sp. JAI131]